jgi:hypothetical protein
MGLPAGQDHRKPPSPVRRRRTGDAPPDLLKPPHGRHTNERERTCGALHATAVPPYAQRAADGTARKARRHQDRDRRHPDGAHKLPHGAEGAVLPIRARTEHISPSTPCYPHGSCAHHRRSEGSLGHTEQYSNDATIGVHSRWHKTSYAGAIEARDNAFRTYLTRHWQRTTFDKSNVGDQHGRT